MARQKEVYIFFTMHTAEFAEVFKYKKKSCLKVYICNKLQ